MANPSAARAGYTQALSRSHRSTCVQSFNARGWGMRDVQCIHRRERVERVPGSSTPSTRSTYVCKGATAGESSREGVGQRGAARESGSCTGDSVRRLHWGNLCTRATRLTRVRQSAHSTLCTSFARFVVMVERMLCGLCTMHCAGRGLTRHACVRYPYRRFVWSGCGL